MIENTFGDCGDASAYFASVANTSCFTTFHFRGRATKIHSPGLCLHILVSHVSVLSLVFFMPLLPTSVRTPDLAYFVGCLWRTCPNILSLPQALLLMWASVFRALFRPHRNSGTRRCKPVSVLLFCIISSSVIECRASTSLGLPSSSSLGPCIHSLTVRILAFIFVCSS